MGREERRKEEESREDRAMSAVGCGLLDAVQVGDSGVLCFHVQRDTPISHWCRVTDSQWIIGGLAARLLQTPPWSLGPPLWASGRT